MIPLKDFILFDSLEALAEKIPDENSARCHIRRILWGNGPYCPYCRSAHVYNFSDPKWHKCAKCRRRFSIKVGTIFEDTKLPLRTWILGIWYLALYGDKITSVCLAEYLEITQPRAWKMKKKILMHMVPLEAT